MRATKTVDQAADMYTKRFTDPRVWHQQLYLNNIVDPKTFWTARSWTDYTANILSPVTSKLAPLHVWHLAHVMNGLKTFWKSQNIRTTLSRLLRGVAMEITIEP